MSLNRITCIPSQRLSVTYNSVNLDITLDTGATVSYIRQSKVIELGVNVFPNNQLALLADQQTRMSSKGEVDFVANLGNIKLRIRALVMDQLQAECFGGTTFHVDNDVEARIQSGTISLHGRFVVSQSNPIQQMPIHPPLSDLKPDTTRESIHPNKGQLNAISLPDSKLVFPEECLQIPIPRLTPSPEYLSISPTFPKAFDAPEWQPQICKVVNNAALFKNLSDAPILAQKYSHFKPIAVNVTDLASVVADQKPTPKLGSLHSLKYKKKNPALGKTMSSPAKICSEISINHSLMSDKQVADLHIINNKFIEVFDNDLTQGYNHKAGLFYADFTFSNKPPPTRVFIPQFNRKCSDLLQAKCDDLELQGVLVDPKLFNISVVHVSPSWIQQKGRAKHKKLQDCTLDELRFITAFNTLNDHIRPKPSTSCSAKTIFTFLARWKHHIFADLNNSYFQLPVRKDLWGYLGIMTPFKGVRVMTRTGQGLLGSDVELEQLLCRVLGEDISKGHCVALRDDIIIGGNNIDEALSNYSSVIQKLHSNNLKLSPNKVRIFPEDTEVYGYRVIKGCILPSQHTVTNLGQAKIEDLVTNKQVNSWKGLYKTLIGHLPALANVMSPFDAATSGKSSSDKFVWNPTLTSAFNAAMKHLDQINKTYLPDPSEQLILLPDAMSVSPCVGWVLYVLREEKLYPVSYCTAKLKDYMLKWYPCEKEAAGVVLALDQCGHWINEAKLPTLVGPDSSSVVKAADLMRRGKHSTNPRLQSLLSSVNRRNIRFYHNSAKAGLHIVPDHLSRLTKRTCEAKDCAVDRFLDDIPVKVEAMSLEATQQDPTLLSMTASNSPSTPPIIAATASELADQLLGRYGSIPLGNRQTWMQIQKSDPDCLAVFNLKSLGEAPRKKGSNPSINKIFKESIVHEGLLVVRSFDTRRMREHDRVVVPPSYLESMLTVLHIKLNHPSQFQLKAVFDRYFFAPKTDAALNKLYSSCHLCISIMKFPKELESYNPSLFPDHPGTTMNIDVVRRAKQFILVCVDLFSSYVTACFLSSEKAEDLAHGIIQAVTPIRNHGEILIRVDKAPGLVKVSKDSSFLKDLGINIVLGDDENKNSNCSVDKIINELEQEIKKVSPSGEPITPVQLAQCVMSLNRKVRNRNFTAAEIHFARDSHDLSNLYLNDNDLRSKQQSLRIKNNTSLAKSRAPKCSPNSETMLEKGDMVFVKKGVTKHTAREPHIVIGNSNSGRVLLRKTLHSSHHDSCAPSLSHKLKEVDPKFLFKPQNESPPNIKDPEEVHHQPCAEESVISCVGDKWSPTNRDDLYDLITVVTNNPPDCLLLNNSSHSEQTVYDAMTQDFPSSSESSPEFQHVNQTDYRIRLFNPGQGDDIDEILDQNRKPVVGDTIAFFDGKCQSWVNATIVRDLSRRYKYYYNIIYPDGREDGLELAPETRWTFTSGDEADNIEAMRLRPGDTISDLTPRPTPEPSLLDRELSVNNSHSDKSVSTLNRTAHSLEWDALGTEFNSSYELFKSRSESSLSDEPNRDVRLTPSPKPRAYSHEFGLNKVNQMDLILPISSTPKEQNKHRKLGHLRRSLPLELEPTKSKDFLPEFFRKFNPFKKKKMQQPDQ